MAQPLQNRRWFHHLSTICCILLAATFVVSGFFKAIDPWGTILAMRNYLVAYNLSVPDWLVRILSIGLSSAELMIGALLLFRVRIRLVSIIAVVTMLFFTVLTLLSATIVPVEDCGCFGEVIKLTPWQSFAKNALLLPMALCVWLRYRSESLFASTKRELLFGAILLLLSVGLGLYSYRHLPLIDVLPYKVGLNIAEEMKQTTEPASEKVVLIYRNRTTGELREFSIDDSEWQNDALWEWVDTRTESNAQPNDSAALLEFYVSDSEGDKTQAMLAEPKLYMLFMAKMALDEDVRERFAAVERYAESNGGVVAYVTSEALLDKTAPYLIYNMDAKTMKTILRADYGLVELEKGVIVAKYNYRDIPY